MIIGVDPFDVDALGSQLFLGGVGSHVEVSVVSGVVVADADHAYLVDSAFFCGFGLAFAAGFGRSGFVGARAGSKREDHGQYEQDGNELFLHSDTSFLLSGVNKNTCCKNTFLLYGTALKSKRKNRWIMTFSSENKMNVQEFPNVHFHTALVYSVYSASMSGLISTVCLPSF